MLDRRLFLKSAAALVATGMLPKSGIASWISGSAELKYPPIGLQTYTLGFLFNAKDADTKSVLKQLADIGIKELETATGNAGGLYYGNKPKEFAAMVNDLGMKWIGNHYQGLPRNSSAQTAANTSSPKQIPGGRRLNLKDDLQEIANNAAEGGCSWIVCASSAESNMDEIKKTTEIFSRAGEAAKKNNIKFAYHNHQSEFAKVEGISAYDYILGQTNKNEVFMEVDLAWAVQAGMDPVEMFKQYPGRFPLWHVKDIDSNTNRPCVIGKGKIDFKHIYQNSSLSGVQHTFIEQDGAKSIEDPATSIKWLKDNIYS